jgi:hypothetical protein
MRNFQRPLAVLLFAILIIAGCKRETLPDKTKSPTEESKTPVSTQQVIYRASAEQIAAAKENWLKSVRTEPKDFAARGGCGRHTRHHIEILEVTGASCSVTSWNVKYIIWSYDEVGSAYVTNPISASFTDMNSNSLSATLLSSSAALADPNCINWWSDTYCDMIREYRYELTNVPAPSSNWPADIGDFTLTLRSGFTGNCTPLTVSGDLKGSFTAAEYEAMPARVTVGATGGTSVLVGTDCALTCIPPYTVCPTGGVFSYRPQGSTGSYTNHTLNATGGLIFSIPSGTHEYSCTLNYTIGGNTYTSLPKTGTFVIP